MKILFGLGLIHTRISSHGNNTLFWREKPFGIKGGRTNYYRFGIVYDKRDEEAVPTHGFWSEILIEHSTKMLKSDYSYMRITFSDRHYWLLHKRLVYAQRFVYENMPGEPPFYEMTVINDSYSRFDGLGGGDSLRGVPRFLFIGPNKMVTNFELRWELAHKVIFKQSLTMYLNTFIDAGWVWLKNDKMALNNIHFSQGIGVHIRWNKDFVGAIDIGRSPYLDYAIYLTFGNLF